MPPPRAVLTFLEANIECSEPWTAAVLELGAPRRGAKQFLGHRIKRRRAIAPPLAKELAQRLGEKTSYSTGDYGCYGDPFGIEIACGAATFQLIADCGHVVLEPEDEDHRIFSESMIELLRKLRGRP